jgi:hypothetical protein
MLAPTTPAACRPAADNQTVMPLLALSLTVSA